MRSSRLAVVTLVAVLPAWCGDTPAAGPTVGVFLQFDTNPGVAPLQVMEREVEELLRPSGVAVDWKMGTLSHGNETFARRIVLKFRGKCRVESPLEGDTELVAAGERTLAFTAIEHGKVLPLSEVQCNEVRTALAYVRPWADGKDRQVAWGMALGRVVAHELYHILARTTNHARHGLAQASQSLKDLVSNSEITFGEDDLKAIRDGMSTGGDQPSAGNEVR